MSEPVAIVVVGAGQAGERAARTLRAEGFTGRIDLVGDECYPPYERPPLSKSVLIGHDDGTRAYLGSADEYAALAIRWRPGIRAVAVDRLNRSVVLSSRERLDYDRLILATGSRVRKLSLPGADHPRVAYLRTIEECYALRRNLSTAGQIVVIGGGWIGLEVAASMRNIGLSVALIEAGPCLCSRSVPEEVSAFLLQLHREKGVDVHLGETVTAIHEQRSGRLDVVLSSGHDTPADLVVVGIGVVPNDELGRDAGLGVDGGILTDAVGRTADPCVFACGDVTNQYSEYLGRRVRLESWANANSQAIAAARSALGLATQNDVVPSFWSEQYGLVLQVLGMPEAHCDSFVRGDIESDSFTRFYLEGERIRTTVAVNRPKDVPVARRLMERRLPVNPERLVNANVRLKKILNELI